MHVTEYCNLIGATVFRAAVFVQPVLSRLPSEDGPRPSRSKPPQSGVAAPSQGGSGNTDSNTLFVLDRKHSTNHSLLALITSTLVNPIQPLLDVNVEEIKTAA